jgi:hypothetical protein
VALNSRICAGMNGKQKKNSVILHGVNAEAKVLAGIRWAHEYEVLAVCVPVTFAGKRMREHSLKAWQVRVPD